MSRSSRWAVGCVVLAVLGALAAPAGAAAAVSSAKEPGYQPIVHLTVDDLQDYWKTEMPALYGVSYRKIPPAKIIPYTSHSKVPRCGPGKVRYKDVAENAFYCNAGRFVAYDAENLFPQLYRSFGEFTIAMTLAHEWGHAIQDQAGLTGPTIAMEQQADCFAGAWVRHVGDGGSPRLHLRQGNLDTGLAGFLTFRDPPGTDPTAEGAHGSAFDRVGAFQEGYDNGPERCKDFADDPPALTDIEFTDQADLDRGGDIPYRQVIPLTAQDLDAYWSGLLDDYRPVEHVTPYDPDRKLPFCNGGTVAKSEAAGSVGYCTDTRSIIYDRALFDGVYKRSGDFGVAVVIAAEWTYAMQEDQGIVGDPKALALQRSCFTGSWAGDVVRGGHNPDGTGLTLSAGDLDQAIQSYLIFPDSKQIAAGTGATAFENVDAFRLGFFQGEAACVDLVPAT